MNNLKELFSDLDSLAELTADATLLAYLNTIHTNRIASHHSSEEEVYFCAVPKYMFSSIGKAYPLLLLHNLYDSQ